MLRSDGGHLAQDESAVLVGIRRSRHKRDNSYRGSNNILDRDRRGRCIQAQPGHCRHRASNRLGILGGTLREVASEEMGPE